MYGKEQERLRDRFRKDRRRVKENLRKQVLNLKKHIRTLIKNGDMEAIKKLIYPDENNR